MQLSKSEGDKYLKIVNSKPCFLSNLAKLSFYLEISERKLLSKCKNSGAKAVSSQKLINEIETLKKLIAYEIE